MTSVVALAEAKRLRLSRYFTGKACSNGHTAYRYVRNSVCIECSRGRRKPPPAVDEIMGEEWRDVAGYIGYQVSNLGRVKSLARSVYHSGGDLTIPVRILASNKEPSGTGYHYVFLSQDGRPKRFRVHTLVLTAFRGPAQGRICRHLDSNPSNNRLENLQWGTHAENMADEYNNGHGPIRHFKLGEDDIRRIRRLRNKMRLRVLAGDFGVSVTTIRNIQIGKTWGHIT